MSIAYRTALASSVLAVFAGCAAPGKEEPEQRVAAKDCVATTGSNICRKAGSGNMNSVQSISGEDLLRAGGPLTGAQPGRISD